MKPSLSIPLFNKITSYLRQSVVKIEWKREVLWGAMAIILITVVASFLLTGSREDHGSVSNTTPNAEVNRTANTSQTMTRQAVPTFTPTGVPGQAVPSTQLSPSSASQTSTSTLMPIQRLEMGKRLYRHGDYAAARSQWGALLASTTIDPRVRLEVLYHLTRTYLAEGLFSEALTTSMELERSLASLPSPVTTSITVSNKITTSLSLSTANLDIQATAQDERTEMNVSWQEELRHKNYFLRAEALRRLGQYSEAIGVYQLFLNEYPWMAESIQEKIAATQLALGNVEQAAVAYRLSADAVENPPAKVRLLEALAQNYTNLGRYADAVDVYDEILAVAQRPHYRAEIQYRVGQVWAVAGEQEEAIARWRASTIEALDSNAAYRSLVELVNREEPFDLYDRGYIDLKASAWIPAINAFEAYLDDVAPNDERASLAMHGMGQAYLGVGNYSAAITVLERTIETYPECECLGQAWLDKAQAQASLGDHISARRTYRTFARTHATDPLAAESLWRSGLLAYRDGNQIEAVMDFVNLADAFPDSERTPYALYIIGIGAMQKGMVNQAVDVFNRLYTNYPDYNRFAAHYWLGRAYQAQGELEQARDLWRVVTETAPDTYYGVLAAHTLRNPTNGMTKSLDDMQRIAGPASTLARDDGSQAFAEAWLTEWVKQPDTLKLSSLPSEVEQDTDLRMGRMLLELEQRGEALGVLERVYQRYRGDARVLYALSLEFERLGTYRLSLISMVHLLQSSPAKLVEDTPIFLQRRAYPQHFSELVEREAIQHGLDPLLYYSLIRQESLFEEGARSHAAAQGLAQIIPDTAQWIADRVQYPGFHNELVYRPHINVRFGAYYLDWARDYLDGNLVSALVGYNAGPGNADHWRSLSGADDALYVELLTYNEPRIYVKKITEGLYHYTRLYGGG